MERQRQRPAVGDVPGRRGVGRGARNDALVHERDQQLVEGRPAETGPRTPMPAVTERQVPVRVAIDVEASGIREAPLVPTIDLPGDTLPITE